MLGDAGARIGGALETFLGIGTTATFAINARHIHGGRDLAEQTGPLLLGLPNQLFGKTNRAAVLAPDLQFALEAVENFLDVGQTLAQILQPQ